MRSSSLITSVAFVALSSGVAVAGSPPVEVKRLNAQRAEGQLVVRYQITPLAWRSLNMESGTPSIGVAFPGQPELMMPLKAREGRLQHPLGSLKPPSEINIRIFDADGPRRMSLGPVVANQLSLPVSAQGVIMPSQGLNLWSVDDHVRATCDRYFSHIDLEMRCREAVSHLPYDPTPLIEACGRAMDGDVNELSCVQIGAQSMVPRVADLEACVSVMSGDDEELECFRLATTADFAITHALHACSEVMTGDPRALACIRVVVKAPVDPTQTIHRCARVAKLDDEELGCISASIGR